MNALQAYFSSFTDRLAYIELQKEVGKAVGLSLLDVPLPLRVQDITKNLDTLQEKVDLSLIAKGIVWNLGIDPDFLHNEIYMDLLSRIVKNPVHFALSLYEDDFSIAARAAYVLDPEDVDAAIAYARALSTLEEGKFLCDAQAVLERILRTNAYHAAANAMLGEINETMGNFIKASSYYERAFLRADSKERTLLEEAKKRIALSLSVEQAVYYLNRGNPLQALSELEEGERYDISYYRGLSYLTLSRFSEAHASFSKSFALGGDFEELYNYAAYAAKALGKDDEALVLLNEGIQKYPNALRLHFNRAVILANREKKEKALEDLHFILEFADISDELFNQAMQLREVLLGD